MSFVLSFFFFEIIPRLGNFRPIILLASRACDNMGNGSIEYLCMCVSRGGGEDDIYSDGIMGSNKNTIKFHKCPSLLKTVSDTMSFVRPLFGAFYWLITYHFLLLDTMSLVRSCVGTYKNMSTQV